MKKVGILQEGLYNKNKANTLKKRKNLSLLTSLTIINQKECAVKHLDNNSKFIQTFNSENFFSKIKDSNKYFIFVKVIFKVTGGARFSEFAGIDGVSFAKVENLAGGLEFENFLQQADWFAELIKEDSLYLFSVNSFESYLKVLQKCFQLESAEINDTYFGLDILYTQECGVFINFKDISTYTELRQLYNKHFSISTI